MCVVIDLDVVCLICLQPNKELHSIFTTDHVDNSELQIAQKISILSELKVDQKNHTLPSKICSKCLQDLKAAWRFRKNCQAAVTIFQTIVKLEPRQQSAQKDVTSLEASSQESKEPHSLQVKRKSNTSKEDDACKIHLESVTNKNVEVLHSNLYDELAPHDYEDNINDDSEKFHTLKVEENEDEGTFIEYYLTEEHSIDETSNVEGKITSNPKAPSKKLAADVHTGEMQNKITDNSESVNKFQRIDRTKRQAEQKQKSNKNNRPVEQKQIIVEKVILDSSEESSKSAKPVVRQVKTRKRRSISPETKSPKICDLCGNSYRYQHALNAHMRRHYNEKPFPCDFCDKAFVSNVELRRHMRVHTGQKPYACQYCDRRFSDFGSRIKHERTHTGERPYHCLTCGKSFAYPHVLSVHVLTHTGEKRFRCEYCSKGFTKKAYLLSHIEQHHNNLQVANEDSTTDDNNQNQTEESKSQDFQECFYPTEFVNDEDINDGEDYDENNCQGPAKIIITQSLMQPKTEAETDEDDIQEIVEVEPDEYTMVVQ